MSAIRSGRRYRPAKNSPHLELLRHARDRYDTTERAYKHAIVRASQHHSLAQVAKAAHTSVSAIRYILKREQERTP